MLMRPGRKRLLKQFTDGTVPADFLYGYVGLSQLNPVFSLEEFEYISSGRKKGGATHWDQLFDGVLSAFSLCNLRIRLAWKHRQLFKDKDVVITNIDSIGLSCALFSVILPQRAKHLHISQGLTNAISSDSRSDRSLKWSLRRLVTNWVLSGVDHTVVLGDGAKDSLLSYQLLKKSQVSVSQFGVDVDFWNPGENEGKSDDASAPYFLSVGSDAGRDYETLLAAKLPLPLKIVSRTQSPAIADRKDVEQLSDIDDAQLRDLYRKAALVVITLHDIPQPSGQSATLQAMSCGAPVLLTRTTGFWDPKRLKDGDGLWLLRKLGDVTELEQKIEGLMEQDQRVRVGQRAREIVEQHYSINDFSKRMHEICVSLSKQNWSPVV